jgi:hypothetical protein
MWCTAKTNPELFLLSLNFGSRNDRLHHQCLLQIAMARHGDKAFKYDMCGCVHHTVLGCKTRNNT